MDEGQSRVMDFYMDRILGGDIVVEQNVYVIDVSKLCGSLLWQTGAHHRKNEWTGAEKDPTFKEGAIANAKAFWDEMMKSNEKFETELKLQW